MSPARLGGRIKGSFGPLHHLQRAVAYALLMHGEEAARKKIGKQPHAKNPSMGAVVLRCAYVDFLRVILSENRFTLFGITRWPS